MYFLKKPFIVLISILFLTNIFVAQNKFFSPNLLSLSDSLSKSRNELDIKKIDSIGQIIFTENHKLDIAYFFKTKGTYYAVLNQLDSSKKHYNLSLLWFNKINNPSSFSLSKQAIVLTNLSNVLLGLSESDDAIECNYKAIAIGKKNKNKKRIAIAYMNIGNIFYQNQKLSEAIENYSHSLSLFEEIKYSQGIANCNNNIGLCLLDQLKYEESTLYLRRALIEHKKNNNKHQTAQAYGNLGLAQANSGLFSESAKNIDAAISLYKSLNNSTGLNESFIHLASLNFLKKKYQQAIDILNSIEPFFKENNLQYKLVTIYSIKSKCYIALGDLKNGIFFDVVKNKYQDSISNIFDEEKMLAYQKEIEKEFQFDKQKAELKAERAELEKKKQINDIIKVVAFMILFLLGITIYQAVKNHKRQKLINIQLSKLNILRKQLGRLQMSKKEKEVLIKEIHHRVKNNLQVIISLLRFQAYQIEDPTTRELIRECQTRVHSMAVIHEQLYKSDNLATINIEEYLKELINQLVESYGVKNNIKVDYNIKASDISLDTLIPLGLIINEIISNSLKYAFNNQENPKIKVSMIKELDNSYSFSIGDNGKGLDNLNTWYESDTLGFDLIKTFTEQIDGNISLNHENGLVFSINFFESQSIEKQVAI